MVTATKFTSKLTGSVEAQIVAALNAANIKGIDLVFSGATRTFGRTETTFKIVATIKGNTNRKDQAFIDACKYDNIDVTKLGRKGEKLIGYRPRATRHPYIWRTVRGAEYIGSASRWKSKL